MNNHQKTKSATLHLGFENRFKLKMIPVSSITIIEQAEASNDPKNWSLTPEEKSGMFKTMKYRLKSVNLTETVSLQPFWIVTQKTSDQELLTRTEIPASDFKLGEPVVTNSGDEIVIERDLTVQCPFVDLELFNQGTLRLEIEADFPYCVPGIVEYAFDFLLDLAFIIPDLTSKDSSAKVGMVVNMELELSPVFADYQFRLDIFSLNCDAKATKNPVLDHYMIWNDQGEKREGAWTIGCVTDSDRKVIQELTWPLQKEGKAFKYKYVLSIIHPKKNDLIIIREKMDLEYHPGDRNSELEKLRAPRPILETFRLEAKEIGSNSWDFLKESFNDENPGDDSDEITEREELETMIADCGMSGFMADVLLLDFSKSMKNMKKNSQRFELKVSIRIEGVSDKLYFPVLVKPHYMQAKFHNDELIIDPIPIGEVRQLNIINMTDLSETILLQGRQYWGNRFFAALELPESMLQSDDPVPFQQILRFDENKIPAQKEYDPLNKTTLSHPVTMIENLKSLISTGYEYPLEKEARKPFSSGGRNFGDSRRNISKKKNKIIRLHAGIDFLVEWTPGETAIPVFAMDDGIIEEYQLFYQGTWALVIKHPDFVVRYGEVQPPMEYSKDISAISTRPALGVSNGLAINLSKSDYEYKELARPHYKFKKKIKVKKGQIIAYVGDLQGKYASMLHLEMYSGNASGSLWGHRGNSTYDEIKLQSYVMSAQNTYPDAILGSQAHFQRRRDLIDPGIYFNNKNLIEVPKEKYKNRS